MKQRSLDKISGVTRFFSIDMYFKKPLHKCIYLYPPTSLGYAANPLIVDPGVCILQGFLVKASPQK